MIMGIVIIIAIMIIAFACIAADMMNNANKLPPPTNCSEAAPSTA